MSVAEALKKRGNDEFGKGNWQKAIEAYSQALVEDPRFAVAASNRGASWMKLNEWRKALDDFDWALHMLNEDGNKNRALVVKTLWRSSVCQRELDEDPTLALDAAMELDPENPKILEGLGIERAYEMENGYRRGSLKDVQIENSLTLPDEYCTQAQLVARAQAQPPQSNSGRPIATPKSKVNSNSKPNADASVSTCQPPAGRAGATFQPPTLPFTYIGLLQATKHHSAAAFKFWSTIRPQDISGVLGKVGLEPEVLDFFDELVKHDPTPNNKALHESLKGFPRYDTARMMLDFANER